jgi:hypothetical protein
MKTKPKASINKELLVWDSGINPPITGPRILKIGRVGFGPFAKFVSNTMIRQGHIQRAVSGTDYFNLCAQMGISFFR